MNGTTTTPTTPAQPQLPAKITEVVDGKSYEFTLDIETQTYRMSVGDDRYVELAVFGKGKNNQDTEKTGVKYFVLGFDKLDAAEKKLGADTALALINAALNNSQRAKANNVFVSKKKADPAGYNAWVQSLDARPYVNTPADAENYTPGERGDSLAALMKLQKEAFAEVMAATTAEAMMAANSKLAEIGARMSALIARAQAERAAVLEQAGEEDSDNN